ncbi:histidine--tRNA ligase [Candidatus Poribacteria bacterium]|nr:histidine--tRNA ligase [Candidatus Poribacteria bacterium]
MSNQEIYRPRPISGFPEWLPEQRLIELKWIDKIRRTFESFGFCSIETPSIEELDVLLAKGETDNEIYTLARLQAEGDDATDARLGLHYDLTVPFARYVAQHFSELVFPFKRYQIQRAWRGERPQDGRYREFYQCDIDVINVDHLPLHFDAEIPAIIYNTLRSLEIGGIQIRINNRKILEGYLKGLGIKDTISAIRTLDKLDKIGEEGVTSTLQSELKLSQDLATRCLALATIRTTETSFVEEVKALGVQSDLLDEGLEELVFVVEELGTLKRGAILADLSIARGFDYYTGTVYETVLLDFPNLGSICSGGRYDNLAGSFINRKLPGVGISFGLSRTFGKLLKEQKLEIGAKCPTDVLMIFPNLEQRENATRTANLLRQRGVNVEMYHAPGKISRQLRYASRKGIPYVWFPPFEDGGIHEVKDMSSGNQTAADPETWCSGS